MREPSAMSAPLEGIAAEPELEHAPSGGALFLAFLRLGLTAFGGPAMIAQIKDLAVRRRAWLDGPTFDDGVVLSQSLAGATAMQVAAYVGLRARGAVGALATYVGLGLPAFVLMLGLSAWYARAQAVPSVLALMNGDGAPEERVWGPVTCDVSSTAPMSRRKGAPTARGGGTVM